MTPKILIVDDDNLICLSLKKVLIKLGYEVEVCMDGAKVLTVVELHQPDIILLDIYLTTHNGLDILKDLQAQFFHIPVIMITAYSDVKIAVSAMKSGAFDFLLKPLDIEQLQLVLTKCKNHLNLKNEVERLNAVLASDEKAQNILEKVNQLLEHLILLKNLLKVMILPFYLKAKVELVKKFLLSIFIKKVQDQIKFLFQ